MILHIFHLSAQLRAVAPIIIRITHCYVFASAMPQRFQIIPLHPKVMWITVIIYYFGIKHPPLFNLPGSSVRGRIITYHKLHTKPTSLSHNPGNSLIYIALTVVCHHHHAYHRRLVPGNSIINPDNIITFNSPFHFL